MTEGLVSRVKRLVSGGVNNFVDTIENTTPEIVMKEAIREIDSAMDQVRDELGRVIANKHLASTRLMEANTKHVDFLEKIQLCIDENRDDLAKAAIARQLDLEAQIPILEKAIEDAATEENELEGYLNALQARKREMDEELAAFTASRASSNDANFGEIAAPDSKEAEQRANKAEAAFNRVLNEATGLPGLVKVERADVAKIAELEELLRENRIQERLAELKATNQ